MNKPPGFQSVDINAFENKNCYDCKHVVCVACGFAGISCFTCKKHKVELIPMQYMPSNFPLRGMVCDSFESRVAIPYVYSRIDRDA